MTRRREKRRKPIVDKYDEYKSYGINFKLESKDAFISYLNSWLEFNYTQEMIMYGNVRIMTFYSFTKANSLHSFKMMVICKSGLKFLQQQCSECATVEDTMKRLHTIFHQYMPDVYQKIKYYLLDLAHYLAVRDNKPMDGGQCSCLLLRIEYFTRRMIWEYLSDLAFSKTDDTVAKYQIFG